MRVEILIRIQGDRYVKSEIAGTGENIKTAVVDLIDLMEFLEEKQTKE